MKKILAIVLALVMVCTMAMAFPGFEYKTSKLGDEKVTTLTGKYTVTDMQNVPVTGLKDVKDVKLYTHGDDVYTTKNDNTVTFAYPDVYDFGDGEVYYAVDASVAQFKLVQGNKVVAYLTETEVENVVSVTATTVKYAKDTKIGCGDYEVAAKGEKLEEDVTVYVANVIDFDEDAMEKVAFTADEQGEWVRVNGKFITVSTTLEVVEHGNLVVNTKVSTAADADVATIKCEDCGKVINVVKKVPANSTALYETWGDYFYLASDVDVTPVTETTTTNPDTGANDVIGVAAALAVVALVSGAAISLKK